MTQEGDSRFRIRRRREAYAEDDTSFLGIVDPYLAAELDVLLPEVRAALSQFSDEIVDLGGGRCPVRWFGLKDFGRIISVDPAYAWYDYEETPEAVMRPPSDVYGGVGERGELIRNLQRAMEYLPTTPSFTGLSPKVIQGLRHGKLVSVILHPESARSWIDRAKDGSLPAVAMWRVFTSEEMVRKILSKLQPGGLLITTGEGISDWDKKPMFPKKLAGFSGGVDINNSALPASRKWQSFGIEPLFPRWPLPFFYRKT